MKRLAGILAAFLVSFGLWESSAIAQIPGGAGQPIVVASCGTPPSPYPGAGLPASLTIGTNGQLCVVASTSLTGSTSNATSAVATSSTNVPTVSYNYGFNGTTWDQLQVDASKYLKVDCAAGCSTANQSVSLGSAEVAAGAYAAGAFATGAGVDGWDLGVQATTASAGCGSGTGVNPCLKQIDTDIKATGNATVYSGNNAAFQPHVCTKHAYAHFTTAADTQLVAANSTNHIYVCDYALSLNGTTNIYLEKATSGTCATLTQIDQVWYGAANSAKGITYPYVQLDTGASAQLCVNSSGSSVLGDVSVNYDQY